MPACNLNVVPGDTVRLVATPAQTGVITRNNSLKTHSHVIRMNAGPLYPDGYTCAFYGNSECGRIEKST